MCLLIIILLFLLLFLIGLIVNLFEISIAAGCIGIFVLIVLIGIVIHIGNKADEEEKLKKEEAQRKDEEQKALAESEYNAKIDAISNKYGKPDKIIRLKGYRYIVICAQQQVVCVNSTVFCLRIFYLQR